jgi:hypothetical protein
MYELKFVAFIPQVLSIKEVFLLFTSFRHSKEIQFEKYIRRTIT